MESLNAEISEENILITILIISPTKIKNKKYGHLFDDLMKFQKIFKNNNHSLRALFFGNYIVAFLMNALINEMNEKDFNFHEDIGTTYL